MVCRVNIEITVFIRHLRILAPRGTTCISIRTRVLKNWNRKVGVTPLPSQYTRPLLLTTLIHLIQRISINHPS